MKRKEFWPPALVAQTFENFSYKNKQECDFDLSKTKHIILIPGMGAPVSQLFKLVRKLRNDDAFKHYGVTAMETGLSLGTFSFTLESLINKIEKELLFNSQASELILYAHSHGGRFASELAIYLQENHPNLKLKVITGGTPITERPLSLRNWLFSLSFRQWPEIKQPELEFFYALYSPEDSIVDSQHATNGSKAKLIELDGFSHDDFRDPDMIIPELKKLLF